MPISSNLMNLALPGYNPQLSGTQPALSPALTQGVSQAFKPVPDVANAFSDSGNFASENSFQPADNFSSGLNNAKPATSSLPNQQAFPSLNAPSPFKDSFTPFSPSSPANSALNTAFAFSKPSLPAVSNAFQLASAQTSPSAGMPGPFQFPMNNLSQPVGQTPAVSPFSQLPFVNPGLSPQGAFPGASSGVSGLASSEATGLSPAQVTGKQVGDIVTKLLEEVPALQDKIDHIDWQALSQEEVLPKLERFRAMLQPKFKHIPQFVDRKVGKLFDDQQNQKLAGQFFEWLRKEPDPEMMASLQQGKKQHQSESLDDDRMDVGSGRSSRPSRFDDEGYETGADEFEPPVKQSLTEKMKSRWQEGSSKLKDKISGFRKGDSPSKSDFKSHRPSSSSKNDGLSEDEMAELESLLGSYGPRKSQSRLGRNDEF